MYSTEFSDIYFSREGAQAEKDYVFVQGNRLTERWESSGKFTICELGFGAGFSFLATANAWMSKARPDSYLRYIGIDLFPLAASTMAKTFFEESESNFSPQDLLLPYSGLDMRVKRHQVVFEKQRIILDLIFVDAYQGLRELQKENTEIDAWYLDGFSPLKNPAMWSVEVIKVCKKLSSPQATLATYSVAKAVRDKLGNEGFVCRRVKGFGSKRNALVAHL